MYFHHSFASLHAAHILIEYTFENKLMVSANNNVMIVNIFKFHGFRASQGALQLYKTITIIHDTHNIIYHRDIQSWFHKMGQIFHQWLACVNAGQPIISPGASPARQAQNWLRPAHEMGSSPHTARARKIYPPKSHLGLHRVYCVAANMDAVNHVSSRRAGLARSGQDRARSAWPHSASSEQLWVDLNVQ